MTQGGFITTAVRHLIAAGVTGEALLAAIADLEAVAPSKGTDDAAERRRARDREYQAERRRQNRQTSADSSDAADAPPNDIYSNPPVPPVEAKASTAPKGRSDRGSRIPEDWEVPAIEDLSTEAQALAKQWPAAAYRAEAEAFRNYWLAESSAKARKSNWNRAWANRIVSVHSRVMRDFKFGNGPSGATPIGTAAKRPMNADELRNAIRFAEDNNDPERAEECRRQLEALRARASPQVHSLVHRAASAMSVRHQ